MNEKTDDRGREVRHKDTAEYSGSKAPETRREADEQSGPSDERLLPGGPRGSKADVGMSGLDRERTDSGGDTAGQEDVAETTRE